MTYRDAKQSYRDIGDRDILARARSLKALVPNVPGDTFDGTGDTGQGHTPLSGRRPHPGQGTTEHGQGTPQPTICAEPDEPADEPPDGLGVDFDVDDDPLGVPKGLVWAVLVLLLIGIGYVAGRVWP